MAYPGGDDYRRGMAKRVGPRPVAPVVQMRKYVAPTPADVKDGGGSKREAGRKALGCLVYTVQDRPISKRRGSGCSSPGWPSTTTPVVTNAKKRAVCGRSEDPKGRESEVGQNVEPGAGKGHCRDSKTRWRITVDERVQQASVGVVLGATNGNRCRLDSLKGLTKLESLDLTCVSRDRR